MDKKFVRLDTTCLSRFHRVLLADDDGSRGFGQAIGNVLINSERISGKLISAEDTLRRLSADQISRVEVMDGTSAGIPGLVGQVVNIKADAEDDLSGSFRWRSRFESETSPYLNFDKLSLLGASGDFVWGASIDSKPGRSFQSGEEIVTNQDGEHAELREEEFRRPSERYTAAANMNWKKYDRFPLKQTSFQTFDKPLGYAYLGYKDFFGHNASIIVQNTFSRESIFDRTLFDATRNNTISQFETRSRLTKPRLVLQIRGSF